MTAGNINPVLSTHGIGRTYSSAHGNVIALEDIDVAVRPGEFVSIIGASGCGKSTLLRIVAGLDRATCGEVHVAGAPVVGPAADRGMVFQGYTLFPWLSILSNVMFGPRMRRVPRREARKSALHWLAMVGLERVSHLFPHQLSGGMQQRVAIARALANEPKVLLMDEPFGALDAQTRGNLQLQLMDLWQRVGMTVVFVTHDLDEAVLLSDRVIVLGAHPGRVVAEIDVPLARPRTHDVYLERAYQQTKRQLRNWICPDQARDASTSASTPARDTGLPDLNAPRTSGTRALGGTAAAHLPESRTPDEASGAS